MSYFHRIASFWRNVFQQPKQDRDLDAELRAHIDLLVHEKMVSGMSESEARRHATIEFEGVEQVKEQVRDIRAGSVFTGWMQDIRYAFRMMRKNPGFTVAAVVALALGIGANTAIFSVVNTVLLRPLPYEDPDRLVFVAHNQSNPVAPANYIDWRQQNHVFSEMGAAELWSPNLADNDRPEHLRGLKLTASMFPVLGVQPLLGRVFTAEEDVPGRDHEVVLSYRIWQRRFAADPNVLGRTIKLNGELYNIIGVMPKSFQFAPFWATKAELWAPMAFGERAASRRGNSLRVFARLKPGVSLQQARAEMGTITGRLEQQFPGSNRNVQVHELREVVVGRIRPMLLVLLGAVGFVLLIACANVAHMLLARAAARKKELAVRIALGARRSRLIRQFLTESVLLSSLAGIAGLLLGIWGIRVLISMTPVNVPFMANTSLDWHVLLFTLSVSMLTGIGFGLAPALKNSAKTLGYGLKENERGSTEGIRHNRLRSVLIASEFSLALVLLVGAGLLVRTFLALGRLDPGFDSHNVLTMAVSVAGTAEQDPARRSLFFQELLQRLSQDPKVESASAVNHIPIAGDIWGLPFFVEGQTPLPEGERQSAIYRVALPNYFATMKAKLVRGRDFTNDDKAGTPGVVIVNETLAKKFWPNADPIGKRISMTRGLDKAVWLSVVGVIQDVRQEDWTSDLDNEVYLPYLQNEDYLTSSSLHFNYLTVVVRTKSDPAAFASDARSIVASLDREVPISEVQTMDDVIAMLSSQPRFLMVLLTAFASVALLLAAVGIYAVMSYSVSRRTHEVGIRMALGARRSDVLRLVIKQGMAVALIGALAGVGASLVLVKLMKSLLFSVEPTDPLTFMAMPTLLCLIALLATFIPAHRATRVEPMQALRYE